MARKYPPMPRLQEKGAVGVVERIEATDRIREPAAEDREDTPRHPEDADDVSNDLP
jgi:hypothetical protein